MTLPESMKIATTSDGAMECEFDNISFFVRIEMEWLAEDVGIYIDIEQPRAHFISFGMDNFSEEEMDGKLSPQCTISISLDNDDDDLDKVITMFQSCKVHKSHSLLPNIVFT